MKRIVSLILAMIILIACCGCVLYENRPERPYDRDHQHDGNKNLDNDVDRDHVRDRDQRI